MTRLGLWPTVTLGLAGGLVAAICGNRSWAKVSGDAILSDPAWAHRPEVTALALVGLACWGVILVTRGRIRRAVVVLGLLAAASTVVAVIHGIVTDPMLPAGEYGWADGDRLVLGTPIGWIALGGAVVGLVAAILARLNVTRWPEMGSKYDAPGDTPAPPSAPETPLDWWRSMDEGHDPTAE